MYHVSCSNNDHQTPDSWTTHNMTLLLTLTRPVTTPTNDLTIGWQNLNPLSHPNVTLAPQARPSKAKWWNFALLAESLVWYPTKWSLTPTKSKHSTDHLPVSCCSVFISFSITPDTQHSGKTIIINFNYYLLIIYLLFRQDQSCGNIIWHSRDKPTACFQQHPLQQISGGRVCVGGEIKFSCKIPQEEQF